MRVLILDAAFQPIEVVGWMRAMTLLVSGKAEVVEEYDDIWIRSTTDEWKLPSILRKIKKYGKKKRKVTFCRQNIYFRDEWMCQYCTTKHTPKELTFDHVLPKSQGGETSWENVVAACHPCNQKKGGRTPREAGMKLIKEPIKPKWVPVLTIRMRANDPESWRNFLYWNVELEPN